MSLQVRQALSSAFMAGGFGLDIVHQNGIYSVFTGSGYETKKGTYTPTDGRPYLELNFFDAGTDAAMLKHWDEEIGTLQVLLHYPELQGAIPADSKAKEITDLFYIGSTHTYLTQRVQMTSGRTLTEGAPVDGWYKLRLRMPYLAFTPR